MRLLESGYSPHSSLDQRGAWNATGLLLQRRRSRRCPGGDLSKARACGSLPRRTLGCNLNEVHSQMVELSKIALKCDRLSAIVSKQPPKRKVHTMKNSRLIFTLLALCLALPFTVATGQAQQQPSAKATAKTSSLTLIPETTGTGDWVTVLCNNIKTPNKKDLFVTASFEAGLYTLTEVFGSGTSNAQARVQVRVLLDGQEVEPGPIAYAERIQTLSADLTEAERIEFILRTVAAASFSYVAVDVPVGVHTVCVQARVDTDGTGDFRAFGAVGKGTLTVEEVRLIKGEDVVAVE